ncbi:MAG: replication protein [Lachnospiraceae bacterium]|nr:replication protein [Lachnospiraceae bacterium]
MEKKKEQRSNKWAFIFYKESSPENYLEILEDIHVPFILSPWHDNDVNNMTGEIKKAHKHGALYFDSLKSYSQVSSLISEKLNAPKHVEVVLSPKGMYEYFTHAENSGKTSYQIEDIEWGCGFELEKFLVEHNTGEFLNSIIDVIEENDFVEFEELVRYARNNNYLLLELIVDKTYFFSRLLDSKRYGSERLTQKNFRR